MRFALPFVKNCATMEIMNTVRLNAYAKLNLTLDITGSDGAYHTLDSLVTTIGLCDRIVARKRKDGLVSVTMRGLGSESIPPERNNAQKAGELFVSAFGTKGADITVFKNIPVGAGLGGSSADAAGVLRALDRLYGVGDTAALKTLADRTGSDTGYLLSGGFARLRGRGERVEPLGACPDLHFVLICPKSGVSTAECYKKYDTLSQNGDAVTDGVLACMREGALQNAAKLFYNGLSAAAQELNPDVKTALEEANAFSPLGASMTGSGSAVFALFETAELCEWAVSRYCGKFRAFYVRSADVQERAKRARNPFALEEEEIE